MNNNIIKKKRVIVGEPPKLKAKRNQIQFYNKKKRSSLDLIMQTGKNNNNGISQWVTCDK